MSYLLVYIYCIKQKNQEKFLDITKKTNKILHEYGAKGEQLFLLQNKKTNYGTTSLREAIPAEANEDIWIGLNYFKDAKHCEEIMKKFDETPETNHLYKEFVDSVSPASRVIRAEFKFLPSKV